jgi:hypothetical protein
MGLLYGALALFAGALAIGASDDTGRLQRGGQTYRIPVPRMSVRIGSSEGAATYLALWRRSVREVTTDDWSGYGFRFYDQMGSQTSLMSDTDRLDIHHQITSSVFTRLDYRLTPH